eukprot:scaffold492_cov257-Pinguiococcus_pyrenoidosus.AAC.18
MPRIVALMLLALFCGRARALVAPRASRVARAWPRTALRCASSSSQTEKSEVHTRSVFGRPLSGGPTSSFSSQEEKERLKAERDARKVGSA